MDLEPKVTGALLIDARADHVPTPFSVSRDGVKFYGISPQQWVFVQEYVTGGDVYIAYAKAFNCSTASARVNAKRTLNRPEIQRVVHDLLAELGRAMSSKRDALTALAMREAMDPDNKASERLKGIELAAKLTGHLDHEDKGNKNKGKVVPTVNVFIKGGDGGSQSVVVGHEDGTDAVAVNITNPMQALLIEANHSVPILPLLDPEVPDE